MDELSRSSEQVFLSEISVSVKKKFLKSQYDPGKWDLAPRMEETPTLIERSDLYNTKERLKLFLNLCPICLDREPAKYANFCKDCQLSRMLRSINVREELC